MHERRIIRDTIADKLKDAQTGAGDRVFPGREAPADVEEILDEGPFILVYTRRDTIAPEDYPKEGAGYVRRTLEVAVEITAAGTWIVDDKLDDLAEEVEVALENVAPRDLGATEIRLTETQIDSTREFQKPLGGALLMYEAKYWRAWRLDTSEAPKICHAYVDGPDGITALMASCADDTCPPPA